MSAQTAAKPTKYSILVLAMSADAGASEAILASVRANIAADFSYTTQEKLASALQQHWDAFLLYDGETSPRDQRNILAIIHEVQPLLPVLVMTNQPTVQAAVDVMCLGARGYIDKSASAHLIQLLREELEAAEARRGGAGLVDEHLQNEVRYRTIIDDQTDCICRYDEDFRLTFVNQAYCEWRRQPAEALLGTSIIDKIAPDDRDNALARVKGLTPENPVHTWARPSTMPDETDRIIEWTDRAIFDMSGQVIEYQAVGRDITDHVRQAKQLQETAALQRNRNHWASMLNTMCDAVIAVSYPDRSLIFASASVEDIFGYPLQRFLGDENFFRWVVHPGDLENAIAAMQQCMHNGFAEVDHRIVWPDGQVRWIQRRAWIIYDELGHPAEIIDTARDITVRKATEEALRVSEERLSLFVEHAPAAIAMFDRNMCYLSYSRRWITDYGLTDDNLIGRSHYEIFPDLPELWREIHHRCLAGAVEKSDADPFMRADGTLNWVRWEIYPWKENQSEMAALFFFLRSSLTVQMLRHRCEPMKRNTGA